MFFHVVTMVTERERTKIVHCVIGATESAGEPERHKRAISEPNQHIRQVRQHAFKIGDHRWRLGRPGGANRAANTRMRPPHQ